MKEYNASERKTWYTLTFILNLCNVSSIYWNNPYNMPYCSAWEIETLSSVVGFVTTGDVVGVIASWTDCMSPRTFCIVDSKCVILSFATVSPIAFCSEKRFFFTLFTLSFWIFLFSGIDVSSWMFLVHFSTFCLQVMDLIEVQTHFQNTYYTFCFDY